MLVERIPPPANGWLPEQPPRLLDDVLDGLWQRLAAESCDDIVCTSRTDVPIRSAQAVAGTAFLRACSNASIVYMYRCRDIAVMEAVWSTA